MPVKRKKSTAEKIAIFTDLFMGRKDAFYTHNPENENGFQKKERVTEEVIYNHLSGRHRYGFYMLLKDKTNVLIIDFDDHDANPPKDFINQAKTYGIPAYLERSKGKGWHVWVFLEKQGVPAYKARSMVYQILQEAEIQPEPEVFPKQDSLTEEEFGNCINAPLFGQSVQEDKTVFVNPHDFKTYDNQWSFLESIELLTEKEIDDLSEINEWDYVRKPSSKNSDEKHLKSESKYVFQALLPCAQKMLKGVSENQRVVCFRLAIHFCTAGFDEDMVENTLFFWARRNTPKKGNRIITDKEISDQCGYGFLPQNTSFGCGDSAIKPYCVPTCQLYKINIENRKH